MRQFITILTFTLLCSVSCRQNSGQVIETVAEEIDFPYISVPSMMSDGHSAAQYVAVHFWDRYFADVEKYAQDSALMEKGYADYLRVLASVPLQVMRTAQDTLLDRAERGGLLDMFLDISEKYLFDANSPYRNEEYYLPALKKAIACKDVSEGRKERAEYLLPKCSLNRLETPAADFSYTMKNGGRGRLYDVKSEYLLLFFSNPGCENCKQIIETLGSSQKISELIISGRLKVLNVYPDEDLEEWYNYMSNYPEEWINCYGDSERLKDDSIYWLRAIPSLYLLDSQKRVIMKDAPVEMILSYPFQ